MALGWFNPRLRIEQWFGTRFLIEPWFDERLLAPPVTAAFDPSLIVPSLGQMEQGGFVGVHYV